MTSEELDEGRDVIFENDNYIFMEILNSQTARYYGKEDIANTWGRKFREGTLYYLIDKKFRGDSIWIHIPNVSTIDIETFDEEVLTLNDLLKKYSFLEKNIMDKVNPFDMGTYFALKAISQGVPPLTDWTMEHVDYLIGNFKYIKGNPRNSIVTLRFDNHEDYFRTFDVSDDTIWVFNILFNSYGNGYEFIDSSDNYNWTDGYILTYNLSDSNKAKVNEILQLLNPGLKVSDNDNDNTKVAKILDQFYPEIGDSLMDEYASLENQARNEKAREEVKDEFCNIYEKFNIFRKRGCFWEYTTPVWNLLRMYESKQMQNSDLLNLISAVGHTLSVTDYYEYIYETYADSFDDETFNREAERVLDKVLDSFEGKNIEKAKKVYSEISKKFEFERWYDFPTDAKKSFYLDKVDLETGKLIIRFRGLERNGVRTSMELEDFLNLIYNYSLF
jgi:hypothetical protein